MRRLVPSACLCKWIAIIVLLFCAGAGSPSNAAENYFMGGLGGLSTLSADHQAQVSGTFNAVTAYGTMNGPAFMVYFGRHFTDHISAQLTYNRSGNTLSPSLAQFGPSGEASYEEERNCHQQSVIADFMLYFRNRRSFARPYLSVGTGWTRLDSTLERVLSTTGSPPMPPQEFSSNAVPLRVAVGIDIFAKKNWAFRYSFAETIRSNAISQHLTPPAPHNLANFQNLFGITWQF